MKKLLTAILLLAFAFVASAQERVNSAPSQLSMKSQEITKALYWEKTSKTGKWTSRKNTTRPYDGEGVHADNFFSIFIGEYNGYDYMFLDLFLGKWRYPNLEREWTYYRYLYAALLTEDDLNALKDLKDGEIYTFIPYFYTSMFKGNAEYSPSFFLSLTESLRSASQTLFEVDKKMYSTTMAEKNRRKKYPPIAFFTAKRTLSDGKDVVRFTVHPHGGDILIDSYYFEVSYDYYMRLFTPDKNVKFK